MNDNGLDKAQEIRENRLAEQTGKEVLKRRLKEQKGKRMVQAIIKLVIAKIQMALLLLLVISSFTILIVALFVVVIDSESNNKSDYSAYEEELNDTTTTTSLSEYLSQFTEEIQDEEEEYYIQKNFYQEVKNITSSIDLSEQQIYALMTIKYNFGSLPTKNGYTFVDVYKEGAGVYQINSWEHNKYIWDNWWSALGEETEVYSSVMDAAFETYIKGVYDFSQSSVGKVYERNCYIYYTQEQLEKFEYTPTKSITRTTNNEEKIFTYEEKL